MLDVVTPGKAGTVQLLRDRPNTCRGTISSDSPRTGSFPLWVGLYCHASTGCERSEQLISEASCQSTRDGRGTEDGCATCRGLISRRLNKVRQVPAL